MKLDVYSLKHLLAGGLYYNKVGSLMHSTSVSV